MRRIMILTVLLSLFISIVPTSLNAETLHIGGEEWNFSGALFNARPQNKPSVHIPAIMTGSLSVDTVVRLGEEYITGISVYGNIKGSYDVYELDTDFALSKTYQELDYSRYKPSKELDILFYGGENSLRVTCKITQTSNNLVRLVISGAFRDNANNWIDCEGIFEATRKGSGGNNNGNNGGNSNNNGSSGGGCHSGFSELAIIICFAPLFKFRKILK